MTIVIYMAVSVNMTIYINSAFVIHMRISVEHYENCSIYGNCRQASTRPDEVWEDFGILWQEFETYQGSKHNILANMINIYIYRI